MNRKSLRTNIGVSLVSISSALAMSTSYAADAPSAKPAAKSSKKAAQLAQSQSSGGGSSTSKSGAVNASESNAGAQIVRLGMSVETVNNVGVANVIAFSKVIETQRASGGLSSVVQTIQKCNSSSQGESFVKNVASLVNSGQSVADLAVLSSGVAKGSVTVEVVDNNLAVAKEAPEKAKAFLQNCATSVRGGSTTDLELVSTLRKAGASSSSLADVAGAFQAPTESFRGELSASARAAYDSLSASQKSRFFTMFKNDAGLPKEGASDVLENSDLRDKFASLTVDASRAYSNPLLAEAAVTANKIIKDQTFNASASLASSDALTYDAMFPNGYNRALVALLAKYSNSSALADTVNDFLGSKTLTISGATKLNQLFSASAGQNTDLLGFRRLLNPSSANLNIALSQGESYFRKNITIAGGGSGIELDVTNTMLKNAIVAVAGSKTQADRMFAVAALGDMNVSGKVTFKNTNANARYTRNVLVIGALNSLKVADNTQIINQGKILAVGAGKLKGASGERITGLKLESKGAIYVGSGNNLNLKDVTFTVGNTKNSLNMYAQNTMTVDGATFNGFGSGSKIYVEATTVDLSNLNFPGGSKVTLASRDGGLAANGTGSGKYPHFGSSMAGKVNFISNVSYNGSQLGNAAQFDAAGQNITIKSYSR